MLCFFTDGNSKALCFFNVRTGSGSGSATQTQLEERLCHHLGFPRVLALNAIGPAHADIEVCWLTPKCVLVNDYSGCRPPEKRRGMALQTRMRSCFPDLVQVPLPFKGHSSREKGEYEFLEEQQSLYNAINYVQSVVTPHAVYVPAFGHPLDELAVKKVRAAVRATTNQPISHPPKHLPYPPARPHTHTHPHTHRAN